MTKFIRLDISGVVARLTLYHSEGNRINFAMREELFDAFEQVAASNAGALIVCGEVRDFCLGGDIREWPGIPAAVLRPRIEVFAKALDCLDQFRIPTIAAVQGGCLGGGFELALSCDLIVAERSAHFAFPEALLGLLTLQGGVIQLSERIGHVKAIELVLLAESIFAEQLASWNVINCVVNDDDLEQEVERIAGRLAAASACVFAATKDLLRLWSRDGAAAAKRALYDLSISLFDTADVQTALRRAAEAVSAGQLFPKAPFTKEEK
jgi:enoyl-CoA hydratase/carnithine racemase